MGRGDIIRGDAGLGDIALGDAARGDIALGDPILGEGARCDPRDGARSGITGEDMLTCGACCKAGVNPAGPTFG